MSNIAQVNQRRTKIAKGLSLAAIEIGDKITLSEGVITELVVLFQAGDRIVPDESPYAVY